MHVDSTFMTWHNLSALRIEVDPHNDPLALGENTEREEAAMMQNGSGIINENTSSGIQFYALSYYFPTTWAATAYPYSVFEAAGSSWPNGFTSDCSSGDGNQCNSWSFVMQFYPWGALAAASTSIGGPQTYQMNLGGKSFTFSDGGAIALGKWTDFVFKVDWGSGTINIWRRDQGQTQFTQVVTDAIAGPPSGNIYFKQGLYRGGNVNGRSDVYWAGPTVRGSSFAGVEMQAFGTANGP